MKKLLSITLLLLLAVGLVGFLLIDNQADHRLQKAFNGFQLNFPKAGQAGESAVEGTATASLGKLPAEANNKKPVRSFAQKVLEVNNYPYNEGKIFRWIFRNGQVYVLDDTEQSILVLNPANGNVIRRFGQRGGAPWENEGISSFDLVGDNLYTLDNTKMAIRKSAVKNPREISYFYKSETGFWDGHPLDGDTYLLITDIESGDKGDFKFDVLDVKNKTISKSHNFREIAGISGNAKYLNVAYEGYFVKAKNKEVFYICSKAGLFLKFDAAGNFIYKASTLDKRPAPKVSTKVFGNATLYVKEPDLNTNYSATADDKYLYILSLVRFEKANNLVVDLYDIKTGAYKSSAEIPNHKGQLPIEILKLDENKMFILYEDMQLVNYELQ